MQFTSQLWKLVILNQWLIPSGSGTNRKRTKTSLRPLETAQKTVSPKKVLGTRSSVSGFLAAIPPADGRHEPSNVLLLPDKCPQRHRILPAYNSKQSFALLLCGVYVQFVDYDQERNIGTVTSFSAFCGSFKNGQSSNAAFA